MTLYVCCNKGFYTEFSTEVQVTHREVESAARIHLLFGFLYSLNIVFRQEILLTKYALHVWRSYKMQDFGVQDWLRR